MINSTVLQKLLLLLLGAQDPSTTAPGDNNWSYADPKHWGVSSPQCIGNYQSPIHLSTASATVFPIPPIKFGYYDIPLKEELKLTNNGHSVQFVVPKTLNGRQPFIVGGLLTNRYEAENVHFHWGSANSKGSEHVIDNRRYDVEMHIVHKNVKYNSTEEASKHPDGLAVLGVMLDIANVPERFFPTIYKVLSGVSSIVKYQSSVNISGAITLEEMLGDLDTKLFYTYRGSLTTPNCAEAVTWFVFPQALPIGPEHVQRFWSILDANGNALTNNFRPLQNLNGRPVYFRAFSLF